MSGEAHVLFRVADAEYVVPASYVLHMESYEGATRVPGTLSHVIGVMQIRQRVVPVVDLRVRFGVPQTEPTIDSRVIVVQWRERVIGLLVDSAREIIKLAVEAFSEPPEVVTERASGYVTALARTNKRMLMLIDLGKVIGEETLRGE